jgi:hypothetical protein
MTPTLTTLEDFEPLFDELWLALGPKDRADYPQRMEVYHRHLRDIRLQSLRVGVARTIQAARMKVLPPVGEIRTQALEHSASLNRAMSHLAKDRAPLPATHCPCQCGGRRWHKVLRDRESGAVREYTAENVRNARMSSEVTAPANFVALLDQLVGEPMLRTFIACKKAPMNPEPSHSHYLGLGDDGCPIYDPDRPAPVHKEAA